MTIEEFHCKLQEATNFPLRPFVIPFLKVTGSCWGLLTLRVPACASWQCDIAGKALLASTTAILLESKTDCRERSGGRVGLADVVPCATYVCLCAGDKGGKPSSMWQLLSL